MTIGYFIYLRGNKIVKLNVSKKVKVRVKSSLKSRDMYYSGKSTELGFYRFDSRFSFLSQTVSCSQGQRTSPNFNCFLL